MYKIEQGAGQVIASDTRCSIEAVDNAVMSLARLCASIVEVSKASQLPVSAPQAALADAGEGLSKLISGRGDLGRATKRMVSIQRASNLEATAFGCPDGLPARTGALSDPTHDRESV